MNSIYPLKKIRYFNEYNSETKKLEYSKYNFNFEKFKTDYNLIGKTKLEIFDKFLLVNGWDYKSPTKVQQNNKQYFFPITQEIIDYNDYISMSIHPGYINSFNLNTYIPYDILVENQFDLVPYSNDQVRRLQDYYFNDQDNNIYSKYNFNFDLFSKDFNVYGNKLLIFTDFISRVIYESDTEIGTNGYGFPNLFIKYFIEAPDLRDYLVEHGNFSMFRNTKKNLYNVDWEDYSKITNLPNVQSLLEEDYLKNGQFIRYPVKYNQNEINEYEIFFKSLAIVGGDQMSKSKTGVGFLYKYKDRPNDIYLITNSHILSNENLESFFGIFEIIDNSNETKSTTAEFKVIGRDKYTDILVGLFDPELFYNKTFDVDLSDYQPIEINLDIDLEENNDVSVIGSLGSIDNRVILNGKIMDTKYNGSFIANSYSIPECLFIDINIDSGLSGAPVLVKRSNQYNLVGMIVGKFQTSFTIALNNFSLMSVINPIIQNYEILKINFKDNLLAFSIGKEQGLTKKWLGISGYYNDPINIRGKDSSLINLKYNGGLVITKFILGFDYVKETFVYETESIIKGSVIPLNGPLLNTKIYSRYIESNKNPIVIKSMTFFDGIRCQYFKFNIGKYSNQNGFFRFNYGFSPLGNFKLNDLDIINKLGYTYGKVYIEYYYYNGNVWILETENVGGNDQTWYNKYNLNTLSRFIQHKFEYPMFLLPYTRSFAHTLYTDMSEENKNPINGRVFPANAVPANAVPANAVPANAVPASAVPASAVPASSTGNF